MQTIDQITTAELMHALCERMQTRYTTVRPALRRKLLELLEDDEMHALTSNGTRTAEAEPFATTVANPGRTESSTVASPVATQERAA